MKPPILFGREDAGGNRSVGPCCSAELPAIVTPEAYSLAADAGPAGVIAFDTPFIFLDGPDQVAFLHPAGGDPPLFGNFLDLSQFHLTPPVRMKKAGHGMQLRMPTGEYYIMFSLPGNCR
jgi:hypothetical protein